MIGRARLGRAWLVSMLFADIINRVYVKPICAGHSKLPPKTGKRAPRHR